jgi:hypothetical protein
MKEVEKTEGLGAETVKKIVEWNGCSNSKKNGGTEQHNKCVNNIKKGKGVL